MWEANATWFYTNNDPANELCFVTFYRTLLRVLSTKKKMLEVLSEQSLLYSRWQQHIEKIQDAGSCGA